MSIDPAHSRHPAEPRYATPDRSALSRSAEPVHGEVERGVDPAILRRRIIAERADLVRTVEELATRLDVKSRLRQSRAEIRETAKIRLRILATIVVRVVRDGAAAVLEGIAVLAQFAADLLSGRRRLQRALPPGPSAPRAALPHPPGGPEPVIAWPPQAATASGPPATAPPEGAVTGSGGTSTWPAPDTIEVERPLVRDAYPGGGPNHRPDRGAAERAYGDRDEPAYGPAAYEVERRYRGQDVDTQDRESIPGVHSYDRAG